MKPQDPSAETSPPDSALDIALAKALRAPLLPAGFRSRLNAALAWAADDHDTESVHARLERERREGLAELDCGYVRLRRRALGNVIGAAFAAGAGVALMLPWLKGALGANAMLAVAALGSLAGLVLASASWRKAGGII